MLKAICLGRSKYDINILMEGAPVEGTTYEFFNKIGCGGGTASNVAVALGRWGIGSAISGVVGNDIFGNRIREEFDKVHLDTRYLEQSFNNDTALSIITINKGTGKFTTYNASDKFVSIKKMDYDFNPDLIVVDGYDSVASKSLLDRFPHSKRVLCADIVTKEVYDLCHKAGYVICTIEFASKATGIPYDENNVKSVAEMYQKLKTKNLKTEFIIFLGDKGVVYCLNNQIKVSPMLQVQVLDRHGDYDMFAAGFSFIIASEGDLEKGVKYGCIAASLNTRTVGARSSIPTLEEVKNLYDQNY